MDEQVNTTLEDNEPIDAIIPQGDSHDVKTAAEAVEQDVEVDSSDKPSEEKLKYDLADFEAIISGKQIEKRKVEPDATGEKASGDENEVEEKDGEEEKRDTVQKATSDKEVVKRTDSRVYDGLETEQERFAFKRMPNEVYAKVYPAYVKAKALEQTLKEKDQEIAQIKNSPMAKPFYDHEEGYRLSEEYKGAEKQYSQATTELQIRQQQLAKVEAGQEWQEIGVNDRGEYVYNGPMLEASPEAKAHLYAAISQLSVIQQNTLREAKGIREGYKGRYNGAANAVENILYQKAPAFKDQNYAGWTIAKQIMNAVPEFSNHPMTKVAGVLFAILKMNEDAAMEAAKAKGVKTIVAQDKRNAGPSSGSVQGANRPQKPKQYNLDDYNALMARGY